MKSGIYCIRHKESGKCYIGQSVNLKKRVNYHVRHTRQYIDRAIQKHGRDQFVFEILELCEESNLNQREVHWIASLNSVAPHGYNLTYGGNSERPSAETRRRMSEWQIGKQHSTETREKISKSHTGKRLSDEQRQALIGRPTWNKGKPRSNATRRKISESLTGRKGKPHSPETIEYLRTINRGNQHSLGYRHTPEAKQKIANSNRRRTISPETRQKMSRSAKRRYNKSNSTPH